MDQDDLKAVTDRLDQPLDRLEQQLHQDSEPDAQDAPDAVRTAEDPRLDVDSLVAIMREAGPDGRADSGDDRLSALRAWRDALVRRHDLARRVAAAGSRSEPTVPMAEGPPPVPRMEDLLGEPLDPALDLRGIERASSHAAIDTFVPEFGHLGPIRRTLARGLARSVAFASRFLTARQGVVNATLVEFVAEEGRRLNRAQEKIEVLTGAVQGILDRQQAYVARRLDELQRLSREAQEKAQALDDRILGHELRLTDAECADAWSRVAEGDRAAEQRRAVADRTHTMARLAEIEQGLAAFEAPAETQDETRDEGEEPLSASLDGLYVNLENHFRGPRELIKDRLESYLPLVESVGAGSAEHPVLDLGCGRGEWLELLAAQGLVARGVEINDVAVSNCRSLGLDVTAEDALDYLRRQPANQLGMVTAIHVVEHLPFEYVVELLSETLRVLRPGGSALFETPNPENIAVSAGTFHCDPTHRRPFVPQLLQFLVQQRGFVRVGIERLVESREQSRLEELESSDPLAERLNPIIGLLNRHFAAPSDFSVIGYKPR